MKPKLYINEGEEVFLPKKYHTINNICAIIYDQVTEIYKEANYKNLHNTILKLDELNINSSEIEESELHILDWLKENKFNAQIEEILTKHLLMSITSDFLSFIFESLYSAQRCKISVAYALLRKPFTDELLILEQLLGNRTDFIQGFFHIGDPNIYDPSNSKSDKKLIIQNAISKLKNNFFFKEDLIFDLRYNKSCKKGINGISNQALHIVTRDPNYKTTEQNLNFIFSQKDDVNNCLQDYYFVVPQLLFYSVSIIDTLVFDLLRDEKNNSLKVIKEFRRLIGYILYSENIKISTKAGSQKIFKSICKELEFTCEKCKHKNKIDSADLELFFKIETFICTNCFSGLLSSKDSVEKIESIFK